MYTKLLQKNKVDFQNSDPSDSYTIFHKLIQPQNKISLPPHLLEDFETPPWQSCPLQPHYHPPPCTSLVSCAVRRLQPSAVRKGERRGCVGVEEGDRHLQQSLKRLPGALPTDLNQ